MLLPESSFAIRGYKEMIELTLPAGSFDSAIEAFTNGADGVYLGLTEFSARKGAKNFTIEELSRLKTAAETSGKTIYVTVNTVLQDDEISRLIPILRRLELLNIDGIIVQDLGLASIIASEFPSIPLHASTQLAVHSSDGVRALAAMGFSRVVLSRELTIEEIRIIREEVPDVELKVFIHGAMCYGFSGLCMASVHLTDRSANKGECSQICRTWFSDEEGKEGFFFSMKDLKSDGETLRELERIGIESVKIEGRMKSPLYAAATAHYYRSLLERKPDAHETDRQLTTAFSRDSSGGWLAGYDKHDPKDMRHTPSLITGTYASHKGIGAGTIGRSTGKNQWSVHLTENIELRDGLLILIQGKHAPDRAVQFAAKGLTDQSGRRVTELKKGSRGTIYVPSEGGDVEGLQLRIVSRHDSALSTHETGAYQPYRYPISFTLTIDWESISIEGRDLPPLLKKPFAFKRPLDVQEAKSAQKSEERITKMFSGSPSLYMKAEEITIINNTDLPLSSLFLPSSSLKSIRNEWFLLADRMIEEAIQQPLDQETALTPAGTLLPERRLLSPEGNYPLPYADLSSVASSLKKGTPIENLLAGIKGTVYLPLPPVFFDEKKEKQALWEILSFRNTNIRVGINNPAHLLWMKEYPEVEVFADIYMYIANRYTASLLLETGINLIGGYAWIERETDCNGYPLHMSEAGKDFTPPLFISRSCYRYDVLGLGCEGCSRNHSYHITQRDKGYRVDVRSCITTVTAESTL